MIRRHSACVKTFISYFCVFFVCTAFACHNKRGESDTRKKIRNRLGMEFVYIRPGTFTMGSPENEPGRGFVYKKGSPDEKRDDEKQHQVTLTKGFYMQTTEVTVGQWKQFINDTGYSGDSSNWWGCKGIGKAEFFINRGFAQENTHPVVCVSWKDVQIFIEWMNKKERVTYRLPTEAEWEYAARAGSNTAFANGDIIETQCKHNPNLDKMGWYCGNSGSKTHPVAQKEPNNWGLYDMHGNVYEWCQDLLYFYPSSVTDPVGTTGSYRVTRGGSWSSITKDCRSANRGGGTPTPATTPSVSDF